MNEIAKLVNEAVKGVLDKMHEKDKLTQANKVQIRELQGKLKQTETNVLSLLTLHKTTQTIFKKTKEIQSGMDEIKLGQVQQNELVEMKLLQMSS